MRQRIRLALILGCLPALPLAAQQSAAPASDASVLTIRTDTRIVNLPLVVRDKHGELVKSLAKDDLTLTEDGKPQSIRYFDHDANLPLALGLLVDVSYSQRDVLDDERTASQTFLDQMLGAQDKAFVVEFAREVDLLADPTGIRATLQAALAQLSTMSPDTTTSQDDSQSGHFHGGGGTQLYDAIFLSSDDVIKKQPNRKALIVLTDGVDRGSKETLVEAIEAAQRADTIIYAIYFAGPQQHGGYGDHGGDHGGGHGGGGRGGGGWPGGGGGWPGGGGGRSGGQGGGGDRPHEEEHVDGRKILERITFETGGALFEVSKKQTVASIYQQIADELRNQYRLEYTPPAHDGPGFHEVIVLPKNKSLYVQTRSGYYSDK